MIRGRFAIGVRVTVAAVVGGCLYFAPAAAQTLQSPALLPPVGEEIAPGESPGGYGPFPALPPDPNADAHAPLPPLEEELALHGGAHLYAPEGDVAFVTRQHARGSATAGESHAACFPPSPLLRLPESWCSPQPFTLFADYLGSDPIQPHRGKWMGSCGYDWDPRFVAYGSYELLGFAFQEGGRRNDGIGHQALVDLDLQLTGTERFHTQFRPLGEKNAGGSFYRFSNPEGYVDNSTAEPDRYWLEGEVGSLFGGWIDDPFVPRDYMIAVGVLPFQLQNLLLMNDDVAGIVISKNTLYMGPFSNVNVQAFGFLDEVDAFRDGAADVVGTNWQIDYRHTFIEASYAYRTHSRVAGREAHYLALAATRLIGPLTLAGRAMFQIEGPGGDGDGELFVLESNVTRSFSGLLHETGFHHGVFYANAFVATRGWAPISGGNFNRLRSTFEVNPLVAIARGVTSDTAGVALGVQLFRDHENQSLTPEVAFESPGGTPVWGFGLGYQIKASPRSFWDFRGLVNWSDDPAFERDGLFLSRTWLF